MTGIPPCPREARWELPADPSVVAKCRALIRETLAEWDLRDLIDDMVIVVTELLGNAVIHGAPPIHLTLRAAQGTLTGSLTDRGAGWPRPLARADPDLEHGRGLRIVAALTDGWGVEPLTGEAGKTIWFARAEPLPRAAAPPPATARPPAGVATRGETQLPTPVSRPPSTVNSLPVQ